MAEANRRTNDRKNSSPVPRAVPSTMSRSARRSSRTAGTSESSQSATPRAASSTGESNRLLSLVLALIGDLSNLLSRVIRSSACRNFVTLTFCPGCLVFWNTRCKPLLDNRLSERECGRFRGHDLDGGTIFFILTKREPLFPAAGRFESAVNAVPLNCRTYSGLPLPAAPTAKMSAVVASEMLFRDASSCR